MNKKYSNINPKAEKKIVEHKKNLSRFVGDIGSKLIIAMILCFLVMAITWVLKFRELLRPLNIPYDKLPMQQITILHDRTGIIILILIVIHLIVKRGWLISFFKNNREFRKNFITRSSIVLIFIFAFLTVPLINYDSFFSTSKEIRTLNRVSVNWYTGKDLSSISSLSDFRENSIKGTQYIDIKNYHLDITGMVDRRLNMAYNQVLKHNQYSKVVTLHCVEWWSVKILWEGVLLKDLLNEAGIKTWSNTVIFRAYDWYSSSLSLDYVMNKNILLAYKMNGIVIPPERWFPFMVVAEDKWGYKWVKRLTEIVISNDPTYKGYWEHGWYNQEGNLTWPIFEPF